MLLPGPPASNAAAGGALRSFFADAAARADSAPPLVLMAAAVACCPGNCAGSNYELAATAAGLGERLPLPRTIAAHEYFEGSIPGSQASDSLNLGAQRHFAAEVCMRSATGVVAPCACRRALLTPLLDPAAAKERLHRCCAAPGAAECAAAQERPLWLAALCTQVQDSEQGRGPSDAACTDAIVHLLQTLVWDTSRWSSGLSSAYLQGLLAPKCAPVQVCLRKPGEMMRL